MLISFSIIHPPVSARQRASNIRIPAGKVKDWRRTIRQVLSLLLEGGHFHIINGRNFANIEISSLQKPLTFGGGLL